MLAKLFNFTNFLNNNNNKKTNLTQTNTAQNGDIKDETQETIIDENQEHKLIENIETTYHFNEKIETKKIIKITPLGNNLSIKTQTTTTKKIRSN